MRIIGRGWFGLSAALALLAGSPAEARRFAVDSPADLPDRAPGDGICAAENGACTLRAAVQEGNTGPGPNTIDLPAGVYELSRLGEEGDEPDAVGDLDVRVDLAILGAGSADSIIDGGGASGIFDVENPVSLLVRDLTIRRGGAERDSLIRNAGTLVLERCRLTDNDAGTLIRNDAVLSVVDCVIEDNRARVIEDRGAHVRLDRTVVRRNRGVLESDQGGHPVIVRSEISDNDGGIYGCPLVTDSVLRDNRDGIACPGSGVVVIRSLIAGHGFAGINSDGSVHVVDSTIRDNGPAPELGAAAGLGVQGRGGIVALGPVIVERSTIEGNRGYGIHVESTAELINVTISGNRAVDGDGGGLVLGDEPGSRIAHCTIVDNVGVGIRVQQHGDEPLRVPVRESIVAANVSDGGAPANCAGRLLLAGHNRFGDAAGCDVLATDTDQVGVDPLLGPLRHNGGPTQTHAPEPGSPALDGGADTGCPATDQRGARRPQAARCDVGAVEALAACGNGALDPGEDCDDANPDEDDCCTTLCRFRETLPGDCDANGAVAVSELVLAVALALDDEQPFRCLALDRDGDLRVTIAELVTAVGVAVDDTTLSCPQAPLR